MTRHVSLMLPVLLTALMILPVTAVAQESVLRLEPEIEPEIELAPVARLTAELKTGVWIARLGGYVALGPNSGKPDINLKRQFDLADSEIAVNAELTLRFDDRWYLRGSGFDFSTSTTNTFARNDAFGSLTLNSGDGFMSSLDMLSVAIEVGFDLFRPFPDPRRAEPSAVTLRVSAIAGVRYVGVDQDVTLTAGGRESISGNWTALYVGPEFELRWATDPRRPDRRAIVFDASLGVGADVAAGGILVHVRSNLTLEFSDNFGFFIGYRLLEVDFEDAPYGFDAGLQGMFVGGNIRF